MAASPFGRKPSLLKQFQRFFVTVAIATGIYWMFIGPAHTSGEFYMRLALTGGACIGASVTTVLILRGESGK